MTQMKPRGSNRKDWWDAHQPLMARQLMASQLYRIPRLNDNHSPATYILLMLEIFCMRLGMIETASANLFQKRVQKMMIEMKFIRSRTWAHKDLCGKTRWGKINREEGRYSPMSGEIMFYKLSQSTLFSLLDSYRLNTTSCPFLGTIFKMCVSCKSLLQGTHRQW